jgi:hypothetical protein
MIKKLRNVLALCAVVTFVLVLVGATTAVAQTKTKKLSGTVLAVDGKNLVVKMSNGDVTTFVPPPERRFVIDGKELTLAELQPGTTLNATITETTTSVTDRTVENLEGTVWYARPPTVILTLPNGENHKYIVAHDSPIKFLDREGKEYTVFALKKGMNVKAQKVTEAERIEIASDTTVTGTAPKQEAAPAPAMAAEPAPAAAPSAPEPAMPKTGSSLPLIGQLGLLAFGLAFVIRRFLL